MKKLNFILSALICTTLVFISCSSDDDTVIYDLDIEKTAVTLHAGGSGTVGITKGNGSYSVVSSDENVAKASIITTDNAKSVRIEAAGKGSATVTVKDETNSQTKNIAVTVNEYLTLDIYELVIGVDEISTVNISQGVGPYSVSSTSGGIVEAYLNGSVVSIVGVAAGEEEVKITDSGSNETAIVQVTVFNNLALSIEGDEYSIVIGESQTIDIRAGSGKYEVEITDVSIATASVDGNVVVVNALSTGSTIMKIKDSQTGQTIEITVKVTVPYMIFETIAAEGATFMFSINADEADRNGVWIDWNNDKIRQDSEIVTAFNEMRTYTATGASTFTVYGKVKRFATYGYAYIKLITGADVSNNNYLTVLELSMHSLNSLDISKNPNINRLILSNNTSLSNIIYPAESKITHLSLSATSFNSLDVSGLQELDTLYCINSQVEDIKIGRLPKLKYLSIWNNNFKSLDITGCPELITLNISQCELSELDLSNSAKFEELYASGDGNHFIHSFDFSKCVNLRVISVPRHGLTTTEVESMFNSIPNPEKLTSLSLWSNDITSLNLSRFTSLKTVDCYRNAISGEGAATLVNSLPTRATGDGAVINIIDKSNMQMGYRTEDNIITVENVNVAKSKNWSVYNLNSGASKIPYGGS